MNSETLHLVCGSERLWSQRTSLTLLPCLKFPTYFKKLVSQMSATPVIMIPFHIHLFRYVTLLPAVGSPPGLGCFG